MKYKQLKIATVIICFTSIQLTAHTTIPEAQPQKSQIQQNTPNEKIANIASMYKGIVKLHVHLGEYVNKGQLLFELDDSLLKIQKKYNEQNYKFMKEVLTGAKKLIQNHSISDDDLQQCLRDVTIAKCQLEETMQALKNSKYYAPFSGTVTNVVNYNGSGLGDNNTEIQITEGKISKAESHKIAIVCNRWPGILNLKVKKEDVVKKGNLLFKINSNSLDTQIAKCEADVEYTKSVYERNKNLYKTHNVSLYDYYKSNISYKLAKMNLNTQKAILKQYSNYAPFSGTVTKIYRYSGSGNGACKPVIELTEK